MKKRKSILIFIMVIGILFGMSVTAFSANNSGSEANTSGNDASNPRTMPTTLRIDTENTYSGMDRAYKDGYSPRVSDGSALIVLPLISSGEIYQNKITATPDMGSGSGSPFVISNYQKTIYLSNEKINGTENTAELFLVTFSLPLSENRTNGVYPVSIKVDGYDSSGSAVSGMFNIYVTITDGKSTQQPAAEATKPTAEPVVMIASSTVTPGTPDAGAEFTMDLTLKNSIDTKAVKNLLVTVSCESKQFNIMEDSNIFAVNSIGEGGTAKLTIKFSTDRSIPAGKYAINFSFAYDSSETLKLASSGSAVVIIKQPIKMEMRLPQVASTVLAGETVPLSFQIMNMGRENVYNVRCEISGYGLIPSNTGFVGTMAGGAEATASVNLYIGSKTMTEGYKGDEKYGDTNGIVTLTYEDSDGNEHSTTKSFMTNIGAPVITSSQQTDDSEKKESTAGQWWISIAVTAVIIAGVTVWLIIRRKRGLIK